MVALWQVLVLCVRNSGKPFKTRHHREWYRQVRLMTGGLTINPPVKGQWVDPETQKLYAERMIPVSILATRPQILEIVKRTAKHYDQLAVMYFKLSDTAEIYTRKGN